MEELPADQDEQDEVAAELTRAQAELAANPRVALEMFERARALSAAALRDAMAGQMRCLIELNRIDDARQVLDQALELFGSSDDDIVALVRAIEEPPELSQ